jgi:hypothetical protein
MCYERQRVKACVDLSAQHALVNAGEGDCVKEGGGGEGDHERDRALGLLLCHNPRH